MRDSNQYPHYQPIYLAGDLRRLSDAALDLLWRVNPDAATGSAPDWLVSLSGGSNTQRAASELMHKLLLILDEVHDIETSPSTRNWLMSRGKIPKTGYLLRHVEEDLHVLRRMLIELSRRLHCQDCRKTGPEIPRRRLRWLAEGVVARADPILAALVEYECD